MPLPNGNLLVLGEEVSPDTLARISLSDNDRENINFAAECLATKKHPANDIRRRLEQMTPAQRQKFFAELDNLFDQALNWYPVLH